MTREEKEVMFIRYLQYLKEAVIHSALTIEERKNLKKKSKVKITVKHLPKELQDWIKARVPQEILAKTGRQDISVDFEPYPFQSQQGIVVYINQLLFRKGEGLIAINVLVPKEILDNLRRQCSDTWDYIFEKEFLYGGLAYDIADWMKLPDSCWTKTSDGFKILVNKRSTFEEWLKRIKWEGK